jgi:hypothetical protein
MPAGPPPLALPPPPQRAGGRVPSGLFPGGPPPRPTYREPFPVRVGQVSIGVFGGTVWMALFGLLAESARGYSWWTFIAAALAFPIILILLRFGDRGVAVGAAISTGMGLSIAVIFVAVKWIAGDWIMW